MRKIFITICTDTADLRYPENTADIITNPADCPQIYAGEEVIFCCSFIGEDLQPVSFSATDTFDLGIDQNFDHSDDLMAYANTFNAAGDWDEASAAAGKLSFRVSTATTGTVEKLANSASLQVKLEIRQFSAGSTLPSVLCQAPAVMHNAIIGTAATAEEAEVFATADQVNTAQNTANAAQSTADTALANATTAQSTADTASANAATAQSTANTALANAATAQTSANSKLQAPVAAGTAGQVLTLDSDAATPVWADPSGGGGLGKLSNDHQLDIVISTMYTADYNGWLFVTASTGDFSVQIDDVSCGPCSTYVNAAEGESNESPNTWLYPVFAGQDIYIVGIRGSDATGILYYCE